MSWIEALILGVIQGLSEFLPISSSGHLVIGKELFGLTTQGASFEVVVHTATVLSTLTIFGKEIVKILKGAVSFSYNKEIQYVIMILLSMLPILVVGFFFKAQVESVFGSGLVIVGCMLLVTAMLLLVAHFLSTKRMSLPLSFTDAFIIGFAQAVAVVPGLSRSGATISVGLMLGKDRAEVAKFSFLMVLIPILGEAFLDLIKGDFAPNASGIRTGVLLIGFFAAYLSGLAACSWMISLVKRAKLWGFALYCSIVGAFCLFYHFFTL